MYRLGFIAIETLFAAVVLIPIFALLERLYFHNRKRAAACTVFAAYLSAVYAAVGLPTVTSIQFDLSVNFVPFVGMAEDFGNSVLNVLLFIPLGLLLPLLWERFRNPLTAALFGLGMSAFIEVLQLASFRTTDINDLITNLAGTVLGFLLARAVLPRLPQLLGEKERQGEVWVACGAAFGVMFFVQPFLSHWLWNLILS